MPQDTSAPQEPEEYDPECYDLALFFLEDLDLSQADVEKHALLLGARIKRAVGDYLKAEELT